MRFDGEEREVKKERILDATFRCVSKYGIDGVTLRSIADEAGVNSALLHYYFGDKENLLAEFIHYLYDQFIKHVEGGLEPSISAEARIEGLMQTAKRFLKEQRDLFVVFIDVWSFCLRSRALQKSYVSIYKRLVVFLEENLDQMVEQETSSTFSKEALAYHFAALVVGIGTLWYMDNGNLNIEAQFRIFEEVFENILVKDEGGSSFT